MEIETYGKVSLVVEKGAYFVVNKALKTLKGDSCRRKYTTKKAARKAFFKVAGSYYLKKG